MNRPQKANYTSTTHHNDLTINAFNIDAYLKDLQKYCDTLENILDKACEYLAKKSAFDCPYNYNPGGDNHEKEECESRCRFSFSRMCTNDRARNPYYMNKKSVNCWKELLMKND